MSVLTARLDEEIKQWRERPLEKAYPYLVVDAATRKCGGAERSSAREC